MTIVFDENISHHLVEFLHRAGAPGEVNHVRKLRWNGKSDLEWMTLAIEAGFIILTGDRNERTRGLAAADFKRMNARVLFLGPFWDSLPIWEKAKWLVQRRDSIAETCEKMNLGSCALVLKNGKILNL